MWLLLLHICLLAPAAWVRYRCEHSTPLGLSWDPACEERGRSCPALLEMVRHLVITPMLCPALLEMVEAHV